MPFCSQHVFRLSCVLFWLVYVLAVAFVCPGLYIHIVSVFRLVAFSNNLFMETIMWPIKCAIKGFCYSLLLLLGSLHSGLHLKSLPVLLFCYPSCVVSGWTNRSSFATCRKTCLAHEIICVWLCSVLFCLVGCRFARFGYFVCYFGFVVFSGFSVCAGLYIHTVSVICFVDRSENLLGPVPFCSQGRGTGKGKGNAFTYRYAYVCVRPSS